MSIQLYNGETAIAKVLALSTMSFEYSKQMDFTYLQEIDASIQNIKLSFHWGKKGDVKTFFLAISGSHSQIWRTIFTYRIFDYNTSTETIVENNESLLEELFEASKGSVASDTSSTLFTEQVAENQRKHSMIVLIDEYISLISKQFANKLLPE